MNAALTRIIIPDGVTSIGDEAFHSCKNLKEAVIPDGLTAIGKYAFAYTGLETVALPDGLTDIGASAFAACGRLSSVTIPDSVTNIGRSAFEWDTNLVLTVGRNSYAETYCKENGLKYAYAK